MVHLSRKALIPGLIVASSLSVGAIAAWAQARFPDTQGHWAQPFIQSLADQKIVAGYPDGTFRPDKPMGRDEFSAITRSAFSQEPVEKEISSGGVYKDVAPDNWAVPAIEASYERGFVQGYPDGSFRPQQPITKAGAISALARNLELPGATGTVVAAPSPAASPVAASPQVAPVAANPAASSTGNNQPTRSQAKRRVSMYPMAITMLMQPLINSPALARAAQAAKPQAIASSNPPSGTSSPAASPTASPSPAAASPQTGVTDYYTDADQIPQDLTSDIAAATRAGIVVNYPNTRVLNPNQPASRGDIAALIHQALVTQGRTAPLGDNPAAAYIVKPR